MGFWKRIEEEFSDKVLGAFKIAKNAEDGVEELMARVKALEEANAKPSKSTKADTKPDATGSN